MSTYYDKATGQVVEWSPVAEGEPAPSNYLPITEDEASSIAAMDHDSWVTIEDGKIVIAGRRIFFCPSSCSFVHEEVWGPRALPEECVEVTPEEYARLMSYLPGSQAIRMVDGRPDIVEIPKAPPTYEDLLVEAHAMRRAAYVAESDPLRNEADYDAVVNGTEPDYTAWLAAVAAIKARYPLPE